MGTTLIGTTLIGTTPMGTTLLARDRFVVEAPGLHEVSAT